MSDIALVEQSAKPDRRIAAPDRPPSSRLRKALRLIETGSARTQKAAAEAAGLSESYLSEAMRKPHVQAFIARRRRENIGIATLMASRRFVELVHAESEHVARDVTFKALQESGDLSDDKPTITNNINVLAGYVVDLVPASPAIDGSAE